jgi:hypothetical protein
VGREFKWCGALREIGELDAQQLDANRISRERPTTGIVSDGPERYYQAITGQIVTLR